MKNTAKHEKISLQCWKVENHDNGGISNMTYNFDPDRWYDGEYNLLEQKLKQGRLTQAEFDRRVEALSSKYDDMLERLDGTYQLPK